MKATPFDNCTARVEVVIDGDPCSVTIAELVRKYQTIEAEMEAAKVHAFNREVMLGWLLLQAKPRMPHGMWGQFIDQYGINLKTAQRRTKLAAAYASSSGGVDMDKVLTAVAAWNAKATTAEDVIDVSKLTLRKAELAAGIRTKQDAETCGPNGSTTEHAPAHVDGVQWGDIKPLAPEDRMSDEEFLAACCAPPAGPTRIGDVVEFKAVPVGVQVLPAKAAERRAAQQNQLALATVYQAVDAERAMRAKADQMRFEREAEYIGILERHTAEWKRFVEGGVE